MTMLSTRNIRVVVGALILLSLTSYLAFSARSFHETEIKVPASFKSGLESQDTPKDAEPPVKINNPAQAQPAAGEIPKPNKNNIAVTGEDKDNHAKPKMGSLSGIGDLADKEKSNKDNEGSLSGDSGVDTQPGKAVPPPAAPAAEKPAGWEAEGQDKNAPGKAPDGFPAKKPTDKKPLEKKPLEKAPENANGKPGAGKVAGANGACKKTDYVVMIDAGSTGSRVHVYAFDTCVSPPVLLKEEFKMLKPGLSSFDTDTAGAAKSLDPLLKLALDTVPEDKQSCTPIAVKATAGLRLLGKTKSDAILKEVRQHLETDYPFAVVEGDGISIMDGSDEGVFAWITTNYLLGNIGTAEKTDTAAVFDLGGGSTQIVFEPDMGDTAQMTKGSHVYDFTFGGRKFTLYQFSHLGYGLMQGRNKINSLVVQSAIKDGQALLKIITKAETKTAKAEVTVKNPCMPPGVKASDVVVEISENEFYVVNFQGPSEASGAQCRYLAEKVLNLETECTSKPCSFNGVYQPSLTKAFHQNSEMWVFSYFYDRTNPLGFPNSFSVEELKDLTKHVCAGETMWKDILLGDSVKALQEEPHWCLDLSFITAMLHTGYNIPLHRELRTAKTIANNELGWCLGASLPLLDPKEGGWKCKVKKVSPNI
ncbi:hypothetical protein PUMCH_000405 [Australozyma saopauloensis]|uniref:guanosine-diphosphatase n=1 Tax=Australozyma saopauloensis TaxID=291208 RepID=A0AAX4H3Q9_9ASCO|nr:hypothetical protein PUMCH_000405 [[Candida] saopauloensis]